jgi:hypothetical protein
MSAAAARPRVLLQTTIPYTEDDWHVGRFSLLRDELAKYADVVARNRENGPDGNDPVLATLDESGFDQLWLLAVDTGEGITKPECGAITRFRAGGGHIFVTRDHMEAVPTARCRRSPSSSRRTRC